MAEAAAPPSPDTTIKPASLGARFLGALIDGLIGSVFTLACNQALVAVGFYDAIPPDFSFTFAKTFMLTVVGFAFDIGINWKLLSSSGQTIGKKAVGTRIVTLDGRLPSMFDLVVKRYAIFNFIVVLPVIGITLTLLNILFIFGRERRCLHDYVAGTRVVKTHTAQMNHA